MFRRITPLIQMFVLFIACAPLLIGSSTLIGQITGSAGAALVAMTLVTAIGTAAAMLITGRPILLAPHIALTAACSFNLVWGNGFAYSSLLTIVAVAGGVLLVLGVTGIAGRIVMAIPPVLAAAMGIAVGLELATTGLRYAGVILTHPVSAITIGSFAARVPLVAGIGLTAGFIAWARNCKYYLEIGAAVSLLTALCVGLVSAPELTVSLTPYGELNFTGPQIDGSMPAHWDRIVALGLFILLNALALLVVFREYFSLSVQKLNQMMALNGACLIVSALLGAPGIALAPEALLARVHANRNGAAGLWFFGLLIIGSIVPGLIMYFGNGVDFGGVGIQYPLAAGTLILGGLTCTTAFRWADWSNGETALTTGTVILFAVSGGSIATAFVAGLGVITLHRTVTGKVDTLPFWCYFTLGFGLIWRFIFS